MCCQNRTFNLHLDITVILTCYMYIYKQLNKDATEYSFVATNAKYHARVSVNHALNGARTDVFIRPVT